jgi:hypothetical protein
MRSRKEFGGFTLGAFTEITRDAHGARDEISRLEGRLRAAVARRDATDAVALDAMYRIACAVRGDPEEGDDGEFYEALGFVPRSKRKKGRLRPVAPTIPALGGGNEGTPSPAVEPRAAAGAARKHGARGKGGPS